MSSDARRVLIPTLLLVAAINGACTSAAISPSSPAAETVVADRLLFGRAIPDGGVVSDEEWQAFVAEFVTPRFPKGLTVWQGNGQWLDAGGRVVREPMFAIEIFHGGSAVEDTAM